MEQTSIPACYIPFLKALVASPDVPHTVRSTAVTSLGVFLCMCKGLLEDNIPLVLKLMEDESEETCVRHAAIRLAADLTLSFPQESAGLVDAILKALREGSSATRQVAYAGYAKLLTENRLNIKTMLAPLARGLCSSQKGGDDIPSGPPTRQLMIQCMQILLESSVASSRWSVAVEVFKQCPRDLKRHVAAVLVGEVLSAADVAAEELNNLVFQALKSGDSDAAGFLCLLTPTHRSLARLDAWLHKEGGNLGVAADEQAVLLQDMMAYASKFSGEGVEVKSRVLGRLKSLLGRKRPMIVAKQAGEEEPHAVVPLNEYEAAINSFKSIAVSGNLRAIV